MDNGQIEDVNCGLTRGGLAAAPAGVESLRFLEELDLSGNRLSAIPPGSVPPTLHGVTLTGNSLEELPEAVLRLPALQRLNCGANRRAAGPLPRPSALPATKPPVSRALLDPLPRLHAPLPLPIHTEAQRGRQCGARSAT